MFLLMGSFYTCKQNVSSKLSEFITLQIYAKILWDDEFFRDLANTPNWYRYFSHLHLKQNITIRSKKSTAFHITLIIGSPSVSTLHIPTKNYMTSAKSSFESALLTILWTKILKYKFTNIDYLLHRGKLSSITKM